MGSAHWAMRYIGARDNRMFWTRTPRAWTWSRSPSRERPKLALTRRGKSIRARKWRRMGWGPRGWTVNRTVPWVRRPPACLIYISMILIYQNNVFVKRNVTIAPGAPAVDPGVGVDRTAGRGECGPRPSSLRQSPLRVSGRGGSSSSSLPV